ncbi:disintegrin and metalloproteinase domain-containing protein 9-like [Leptodactylus fuscus]
MHKVCKLLSPRCLELHTGVIYDLSMDQLLYSFTLKGKPLTISLEKQIFLNRDFQVFIDNKEETWLSTFTVTMGDCFYFGQILESNESSVTLGTCFGLRGIIHFVNESFIIEPLPRTHNFLHVIYKMEANEDIAMVISENDTDLDSHNYQHKLLKPFQGVKTIETSIFSTRRYVKVSLFVTVEAKFLPLQMEIFLATVDLWIKSDLCVIADSVSDTLENFNEWLSGLSPNPRSFNIPLLIVDGQHSGIGKTYYGQMCSNNNGAVLTFPKGLSLEKFSCLISHILGHNVGMLHHDSGECACLDSPCIMDVNMMTAPDSKTFSDCSIIEFQNFIMKTGALCLATHPNAKPLVNPSLCGNRVLDSGEACDCGTEEFLPYGTLCRKKTEECDLHEYCSGTMAACPEDVFEQNGNPCNDKKSVCYNGKCRNLDLECMQYFGPASRNADLECYEKLNVIGDRFGNCGQVQGLYGSCKPQDVLCGKLHCIIMDGEAISRSDMAISYYTSKHLTCLSGDFLTGYFTDPLWVKDGTKCGEDKICINKKCTNISRSDASCKRETTCHGHGVCNSKHKCHCDAGWNPPFCNNPGDFGKIDSRTVTDTDKNGNMCSSTAGMSLMSWLLITFLLILPLTSVMLIFCKRKFSQRFLHSADEESKSNSSEKESNGSDEDES